MELKAAIDHGHRHQNINAHTFSPRSANPGENNAFTFVPSQPISIKERQLLKYEGYLES